MSLETATYITQLNSANPTASDPKSQGDDHLRLIKAVLLATFPNLNAAVNCTPAELNALVGLTISAFAKTLLDDADAATARGTLGLGAMALLSVPAAGMLKSDGSTLSVATAGTDYMKVDAEMDLTGAITHTETTLTDGANIDWNLDTQQNAKVTLGGDRVMNAPSNAKAGRFVGLRAVQDGTGGRALTFASAYKGMTGVTPVTSANAVNFYLFRCIDTTNLALVGFRSNCEA